MKFLAGILALFGLNAMASMSMVADNGHDIKRALVEAMEDAGVRCSPIEATRNTNKYDYLFYRNTIKRYLETEGSTAEVLANPERIRVEFEDYGTTKTFDFYTADGYRTLTEIIESETYTINEDVNIGTLAEPRFVTETTVKTLQKVKCSVAQ